MVIKIETTNQRGEKIIDGTAEVAQPPTVYVFTGQELQKPGMGIDLYFCPAKLLGAPIRTNEIRECNAQCGQCALDTRGYGWVLRQERRGKTHD